MWNEDIFQIYDILYRLGVTADDAGFFHSSYAVLLAVKQPERLLMATKWLYPDVARRYATSCDCVERDIRAAAGIAWKQNRPLLDQLARRDLPACPDACQFLAILASHLIGTTAA